jgi:3-hydroxyacyl-[acyl-carrier-protein] dehydratase
MLDRIVLAEPGVRVVGVKNLTGNEWFYQGHFPKRAVTPGAMICEALAQTAIVLFHATRHEAVEQDVTYLLGTVKMRFLEPVWPGDQLRLDVAPGKITAHGAILTAQAMVDGRVVARGELSLSAKPNREL